MENFTLERLERYTLLRVNVPRLDVAIASALKAEFVLLSGTMSHRVLLDLSACKSCDSSGLGAILVGHRQCRDAGGRLVLTGLSPMVESLIAISHLDSVLAVACSQQEIESAFGG
ncbi:MAG: anti-anti-sigma factor [Bacteroidia bacterium]|nr:MAG: anti-anti-sigma factor [Bacteroidia bacterium]